MPPTDDRTFAGKTVALTGAAGGIGAALAHRFARGGARLGLLDRDANAVRALADELQTTGAEAKAIPCDVTSWDACQTAMQEVERTFGGVDVLINNAGITHVSRVRDTDVSVIERLMAVNFFGALYCTKAALPTLLKRQGHIVVLSSVAGFAPLAGRCGYAASKHALHGLFNTLRAEERAANLHVMIVCPSFTRTNIEANALGAHGEKLTEKRQVYGAEAEPADVADAIYTGLVRGRHLLVLHPVGKLARFLTFIAPDTYERMMVKRMLPD